MESSNIMQDGNNELLAIGGSGKVGNYCINKWLSEKKINKVWNFDINKLNNPKVINFEANILHQKGYEKLSEILAEIKPEKIIIFAGYDFPRNKNHKNFFSPYEVSNKESHKAWEINCLIPLIILRCIEENKYKNITLTLLGSIYGDRLPKANLYSASGDLYKPVVYGMCKRALEYLNKQASISMSKIQGRCNLLRYGGIDLDIDQEFKERYCSFSPSKKMVNIESVYKSLTFVAINNIQDLNGAVIDVDSALRHA